MITTRGRLLNKGMSSFLKNQKCLITGGAGFLGSHLVERLLGLEASVTVLDIVPKSTRSLLQAKGLADKITYIQGDVRRPEDLAFIPDEKFDYVFHLAAQPVSGLSNRDTELTMDINVNGTKNVCRAAGLSSNTRMILASSACFYGAPPQGSCPLNEEDAPNPGLYMYSESKQGAEKAVRDDTANAVIGRFVNVYGPGDRHFSRIIPRTIRQLLQNEQIALTRGNGETVLDYLFVEDAIEGFIAMAQFITDNTRSGDPQVFNFGVGGQHPVSVRKLVEMISNSYDGTSRELEFPDPPPERPITKFLDPSKAQKLLNWRPSYELNTGLPRTLSWYRDNLKAIEHLEDREFAPAAVT
jgi:nucleoside-diphosphate-sugar epimerase